MNKNDSRATLKPKLRFPEFRGSKSWTVELGGAVFDQVSNKDHNSDLPILAITQEYGAIPRELIDYHVSVADASIEGYKVVEVGDFIISLRSFQGGIEYSKYRGICSPAYVILRLKSGYCSEYFRHYLKTERFISQMTKNLEGLRDGKMISYKQFSELSLAFPSREEQERIAEILSSLDELISIEGKKLASLNLQRSNLLQTLFPCTGNIPLLHLSGFTSTKPWRKRVVSNLLEKTIRPVSIQKGATYQEIGIRSHGKGIFHKNPISGADLGEKRVFWVEEDALAINIVFAWEQAVAVTSAAEKGLIASHRFPMYRPKEAVDVNFIKYLFLTPKGKELLGVASPGGAGRNKTLGQKEFEKLELLIPEDVSEQAAIADTLSSIDDLVALHSQRIESLKENKRGLILQLFPILDEVSA